MKLRSDDNSMFLVGLVRQGIPSYSGSSSLLKDALDMLDALFTEGMRYARENEGLEAGRHPCLKLQRDCMG